MATTEKNSTLDDLKDLFWLTQERFGYLLDTLAGNNVDTTDAEWVADELREAVIKALAKHVPGLSVGTNGLPLYQSADVFHKVRTYDNGTKIAESISFEDADGLVFTYRPRHDKPRDEFMAWAREEADKHKADVHARYVSIGSLGIEYVGSNQGDFVVHLGDDEHATFDRAHLLELSDGIDRLLATQTKELDEVREHEDHDCSPASE